MRKPDRSEAPDPGLPLPETLLQNPAYLMLAILRQGRRRASAQPGGPRLPQMLVMSCLLEFGPASQGEVARRLRFDPSDLVGVVDALEEQGLAVRERDPHDRRRYALQATERGRKWMRELRRHRGTGLLSGLSDDEAGQLVALLRKTLRGLDPSAVPESGTPDRPSRARARGAAGTAPRDGASRRTTG